MRLGSALLLLGLMAVTLLIFGSIETLRIAPKVAKVTEVRGEAVAIIPSRLERKEPATRPLTVGSLVLTGMRIRTGKNSSVTLKWVDEVEMRIGPDTEMQVMRSSYDRATKALEGLFRLNLGTIFVNLKRKLPARSRLELETPAITAAVRGTVFEVSVAPNGTTVVEVLEGTVAVRTVQKAQEVTLTAGKRLIASSEGIVTITESAEKRTP